MKTVSLEGKTYTVPDDATLDEIDAFIKQSDLPARQAASKAAFEANLPKYDPINALLNYGSDLASKAGSAIQPYMPKMSDLPAATGAALGMAAGAEFPPAIPFTAAIGAAGGEAARQLYRQVTGQQQEANIPQMAQQGLGAGAALAAIPTAEALGQGAGSLADAIRARMLSGLKTSAQAGFNTLSNQIGSQTGDYANVKPILEEARNINQVSKTYIPGPMRGSVGTNILADQPVTFDDARIAASRAGNLSQFETARTDAAMHYRLQQFAKAMDDGNRALAVKNGLGDVYDAAMADWAKYKGIQDKADIIAKYGKRILIGAALGAGGVAGGYGIRGLINELTGGQ